MLKSLSSRHLRIHQRHYNPLISTHRNNRFDRAPLSFSIAPGSSSRADHLRGANWRGPRRSRCCDCRWDRAWWLVPEGSFGGRRSYPPDLSTPRTLRLRLCRKNEAKCARFRRYLDPHPIPLDRRVSSYLSDRQRTSQTLLNASTPLDD